MEHAWRDFDSWVQEAEADDVRTFASKMAGALSVKIGDEEAAALCTRMMLATILEHAPARQGGEDAAA